MRHIKATATSLSLLVLTNYVIAEAFDFPGQTPGIKISTQLNSEFEASGGAWQPRIERLFVVSDAGSLAVMDRSGELTTQWDIDGNWEGLAVAKPESNLIYLAEENSAHIREFNFESETLTARTFDLTQASTDPGIDALTAEDIEALVDSGDGKGIESMCFVPNSSEREGGLFYVGSQENGTIYKFRLSLSTGNDVQYVGKIKNWEYKDLAGLEYDWINNKILAVWDKQNRIMLLSPEGEPLKEWLLPADSENEEGLSYDGSSLYISEDDSDESHGVIRYDNFNY